MPQLVPMDFHGDEVSYFLDDEGQPWWPAKGPCIILGYHGAGVSQTMERLDPDEKGMHRILRSNGMALKQWCVNEPGMFRLILDSEKEEAKQFKRWLLHEVLPAIRKHGRYSVTEREVISGFLSPVFLPWEKRFELEFFQEVCRVYAQPIPTTTQHSPMCGWFIDRYIYGVLPASVQAEMDRLNPIVSSVHPDTGKRVTSRKMKLHQLLKEERVKDFLERRITQLMTVMRLCRGQHAKDDFHAKIALHDATVGLEVRISEANRVVLSMILPQQLSMFDSEPSVREEA